MNKKEPTLVTINFTSTENIDIFSSLASLTPPSYLHKKDNKGTLERLYLFWKTQKFDYINFSLTNKYFTISQEELSNLTQSTSLGLPKKTFIDATLQENYRTKYYGYDFRLMMSALKKFFPNYYTFAAEKVVVKNIFYDVLGVCSYDFFQNFCTFLFSVLEICDKVIKSKYCEFQNDYLYFLSIYLFNIYIQYHMEKDSLSVINLENILEIINQDLTSLTITATTYEATIVDYILSRNLSKAEEVVAQLKDTYNVTKYASLLKEYNRQKRYYQFTDFDGDFNLEQLLETKDFSPAISHRKKHVLIFQWHSVSHEESVYAFESLGFTYDTYRFDMEHLEDSELFLEQLNCHLDLHSFDLVFTLNYFPMLSEACYVHNIPYIAWCYDSPAGVGNTRFLKHDTTHVFMFDSLDAESYIQRGFHNVHYMPLGVNIDRFDSIISSPKDIIDYSSDISFVGRLYDTTLPQAMNYLTDYQKAYLNALVDNQSKVYNESYFDYILNDKFMDWLSQPDFNKMLRIDAKSSDINEEVPHYSGLRLLLNKLITNRERLLLISLLSKHHNMVLYSDSTHKVFEQTIQRGTIEYYQEMPKVFKHSRINLNMTFRNIRTGIPLRCLDIMGNHGLLLTNHQKDFDAHFKDQENLLFYSSIEEAYEKANFYLSHESQRAKIAENGYQTVKNHYQFTDLLKKMMEISNLTHLFT